MRAIPIAATHVLLWAGHVMADENCKVAQDVINYSHTADPTLDYTIYPGEDSNPSMIVFSRPRQDEILVVEFKNGCMLDGIQMTRAQFAPWLIGKKSNR